MVGHKKRKIRTLTEAIMSEAMRLIDNRKASKLTTAQYNSIYTAIGQILDGNV